MRSLLFILVAVATARAEPDPMPVVQLADAVWKPKEALPHGAFGAVLRGDPAKGGYDFLGKFPASYTVPRHYHTNDVVVVMLKGTMVIGRDGRAATSIGEHGLFVLPAKLVYTAHCAAACLFLVHGDKPFDIIYADPKDDPRRK